VASGSSRTSSVSRTRSTLITPGPPMRRARWSHPFRDAAA
jgi:hypothetical protein